MAEQHLSCIADPVALVYLPRLSYALLLLSNLLLMV